MPEGVTKPTRLAVMRAALPAAELGGCAKAPVPHDCYQRQPGSDRITSVDAPAPLAYSFAISLRLYSTV